MSNRDGALPVLECMYAEMVCQSYTCTLEFSFLKARRGTKEKGKAFFCLGQQEVETGPCVLGPYMCKHVYLLAHAHPYLSGGRTSMCDLVGLPEANQAIACCFCLYLQPVLGQTSVSSR